MTDGRLERATLLLALAGLAIAAYLAWVHYAGVVPACPGNGGCERVQNSRYAMLAGVPVALLGVIAYATLLAALALPGGHGRTAAAVVALSGSGFSAYLTYLELFAIRAICPWCVASAVVMTALAVLTSWRAARVP